MQFRASRAIEAMFFSLLGGAWFALWSVRAFGVQPFPLILIALCGLTLFGSAFRIYQKNKAALSPDADSPEKKKAVRIFHLVNAGQWILILVAGNVLVNIGYSDWVIAAVIFIIGLHFLPLASVFKYPPHYFTGAALILCAIGYPFLTKIGPVNPTGCLGAGVILWTSAIYGLSVKPFTR